MIDKIPHYSIENPACIYDEEAMTALELAGRTAAKVNEVIDAQAKNEASTVLRLTQQDAQIEQQNERIDDFQNEGIPSAVYEAMQDALADGVFDTLISEYAGDLTERVDNLLATVPEGGTTMDAEVIDGRHGADGFTYLNIGGAIRAQVENTISVADQKVRNSGVYSVPLKWKGVVSNKYYRYDAEPFKIPATGVSVRVSEYGSYTVGTTKNAKCLCRVYLGTMVDGAFTEDAELSKQYYGTFYTNRIVYIPYIEGVYVKISCALVSGDNLLTPSNYEQFGNIYDAVRAYAGAINGGGNLLGTATGTVISNATQKWTPGWNLNGYIYKYCALFTPLPLQYVDRVVCNPDVWMTARIYKFNPATRETVWVKTVHHSENHPCFGTECVIDFTEYAENDFAILAFGHVPMCAEYATTGYNGVSTGSSGTTVLGLNVSHLTKGVHVAWNCEPYIRDTAHGSTSIVQRNLELLKNMKHKTVAGQFPNSRETATHYVLPMEEFAGTFYGGTYTAGTVYYNVSPATYFTALLNPNSLAYGTEYAGQSGRYYGLMCSALTALAHGYPMPLSTFDMRYNESLPYFERNGMDLSRNIGKLKPYDIITQGIGETGHSVLVTDIKTVGDNVTLLNVLESVACGTREMLFMLHNGLDFYKSKPEEWFNDAYDFHNPTLPEHDQTIHDKALWVPAYTEPQRVMCSRGYDSVYIDTVTKVILSVAKDVTSITITKDGQLVGTYVVDDITNQEQNGYYLVDISDKVGAGDIVVRNNVDDSEEHFHVIDRPTDTVTAELNDTALTVRVSNPEKVKYIEVIRRYEVGGEYPNETAICHYMPAFVGGVMTLPNAIETDIGVASMTQHNTEFDYRDFVNVCFYTDFDTNTYGIDAQGDIYI